MYPQNFAVMGSTQLALGDVVNANYDGANEKNMFATVMAKCIAISTLACISMVKKNIFIFDPSGWTISITVISRSAHYIKGVRKVLCCNHANGLRNFYVTCMGAVYGNCVMGSKP